MRIPANSTLRYSVDDVRVAPSDPPDGDWHTAIARCSVEDAQGNRESSFGYASDVTATQEMVDRAISEGIERATVQLLYRSESLATTTGSAVHVTAPDAMTRARRELLGTLELIRRFHARDMRLRSLAAPVEFSPPGTNVAAWIDRESGLMFCAVLDVNARPKLAMTVRDCTAMSEQRALHLCVVEIMQPRPWVRHLLSRAAVPAGSGNTIRCAEDRALFWSLVDDRTATRTFEELSGGTPSSARVFYDEAVVAELALDGELGPRFFARVEDALTLGRYLASEVEQSRYWRGADSAFVPHPMI